MKITLNRQFADLLIAIRAETGMGISQIIYKALTEYAAKVIKEKVQ